WGRSHAGAEGGSALQSRPSVGSPVDPSEDAGPVEVASPRVDDVSSTCIPVASVEAVAVAVSPVEVSPAGGSPAFPHAVAPQTHAMATERRTGREHIIATLGLSMSPTLAIAITLVAYKLALLAIGVAANRRTHDGTDFFLGGRGLG